MISHHLGTARLHRRTFSGSEEFDGQHLFRRHRTPLCPCRHKGALAEKGAYGRHCLLIVRSFNRLQGGSNRVAQRFGPTPKPHRPGRFSLRGNDTCQTCGRPPRPEGRGLHRLSIPVVNDEASRRLLVTFRSGPLTPSVLSLTHTRRLQPQLLRQLNTG
jgi:hypothetical protein